MCQFFVREGARSCVDFLRGRWSTFCGEVLEFVWGRWLVCQFLCGGGGEFLWGKVLEFVCGEGGRVGWICVWGRWSGGSILCVGEGGREWVNLCVPKVDRRQGGWPCAVGQGCVGQQCVDLAR